MQRILVLILLMTIVFGQSAFCQSKTGKGSSTQDLMIKSEVETAISMLQTIFSKHQKGELTLEQAKQLGAELLRGLRYGKDGYFGQTRQKASTWFYMAGKMSKGKTDWNLRTTRASSLLETSSQRRKPEADM